MRREVACLTRSDQWRECAQGERRKPAAGGLGLAALVSIGIGGMVGGGIFSVLGLTVQLAGGGAYLSFVAGGIVAALTGWSYSLLSVRIRSRGGTATFLDRAFGTSIAGPLNLLLWLSYFVMLGLYAVAFGAYLAALLGLDANGPWQRVFASVVVVGFAGLNLAGAQLVGRAESVLVYFKLTVLLIFCGGGLAFVNTARVSAAAYPSAGAVVYAGALIFLGYEGFELIAGPRGRPQPGAHAAACLPDRDRRRHRAVRAGRLRGGGQPVAARHRRRKRLRARRGRAPLPRLGRFHADRHRRGGVHLQRDQRDPVRRRQVHLPDGPRRRAARPVRPAGLERPIGGLAATTAGTLLIVNTVNIEGISLMGSAGVLIIFAAVNLAAARLAATGGRAKALSLAGALSCAASLAALIAYAATHIPGQLAVLGGLLAAAAAGETLIRRRGRPAAQPAAPLAQSLPRPGPGRRRHS